MRKGAVSRSGVSVSRIGACALALCLCLGWFGFTQAEQEPAAQQPGPDYRIGVNDRLTIFIYQENRSEDCLVRPDGKITLTLAGDIHAAGKTPAELSEVVAKAIGSYVKDPIVTVAVREIHSYRVFVIGRVGAQAMLEAPTPLRLLQALAMAGGLTDFASKEILVIREGPKGQERISADYGKILAGKAPEMNMLLQSGDVVVAL